MKIVTVPCRSDNYAYLVICEQTMCAAVVDPSEAEPVLEAIALAGVEVKAIWNTHHHYDHVEGNAEITKKFSECQVLAHESDEGRVPGQSVFLRDGDEVAIGEEVRARVLFNPGHTHGAISYYVASPYVASPYVASPKVVFTGDTLFAAGCGRLFEGTAEQMHASLLRLTSLPESTQIYCGHEYSEGNLRFAQAVEPANRSIEERLKKVAALRAEGLSTMGFTVAEERATNVFVRTDVPGVRASAENAGDKSTCDSPVAVFAALRRWKDSF